jgi:hypothetical protein
MPHHQSFSKNRTGGHVKIALHLSYARKPNARHVMSRFYLGLNCHMVYFHCFARTIQRVPKRAELSTANCHIV